MSQDFIEDVSVIIGGQEFLGWQDVSVNISIDAISRSFQLQMAYDKRSNFPAIIPGAQCQILINGYKVITGYIDEITSQKTNKNHSRVVTGRSITRNIVDSSVWLKKNQINDSTPFQICQRIAADFDIEVLNEAGDQRAIPIFRWADGARAGSVMQDACRQQGLTLRDNPDGQLVVTRPRERPSRGVVRESRGKGDNESNVEGWRIQRSEMLRYSHYVVKGRSSQRDGKSGNQRVGEAQDTGVASFRPLIVQAEGDVNNGVLQRRANHEAQKRIAMSYPANITLSGWRHTQDKEPWRIDETLAVEVPSEEFAETLLIRSLTFTKREGAGTHTRMELVDPDSYIAEPNTGRAGEKKKAKFDPSRFITDLGPARNFIDGVGVSDSDRISG